MIKTQSFSPRLVMAILVMLLFGVFSGNTLAAGTASGTTINSGVATINYKVNLIVQPAVESNGGVDYTFVVDTKINLTVATVDVATVKITPGSVDQVLEFTVTNNGNATQDFGLSIVTLVGGTGKFGDTDNENADSVAVYEDVDASGTYNAGDTDVHIDALAADATATVFIVASFATAANFTDGEFASYYLLAEARINDGAATLGGALTQTAVADTEGSVDIVFADIDGDGAGADDASRDAKHSSQDDYEVSGASLSISKTSTVISDPFNGTSDPKRIPLAIVQYQIEITNGGSAATATNIGIVDNLDTEITAGRLVLNMDTWAAADEVWIDHPADGDNEVTDGGTVGDTFLSTGETKDGVTADFGATTANVLTVSGVSLAAGEVVTIRFQVEIQ